MSERGKKSTGKKAAGALNGGSGAFLSTNFVWSDDAPRNVDAECGVLASILLDESGEVMGSCVMNKIREEYFFDAKNAKIYSAMLALHNETKPIDVVLLSEKLKSMGYLEKIGVDYISNDILGRVETIANFREWIEILREKYFLRKISRECVVTLDKVRNNKGSIEALIDNVEEAFLNINTDRVGDNIRKASEQVDSAVSKINEIIANKGAIRGVPMGFKDLDSKTHGLHANEMIVIAGRPGTGKTSIALNIVESAIFSNPPYPTLVFSLEMLADDLYMRMIASRARADQHKLAEGRIDNKTKADILTTAKELKGSPLWIDDTAGLSIMEMRAKARRLNQQLQQKGSKLGLIVVDYLQLLRGSDPTLPREQEIAEISRGMKAMAKELLVPVIVLAQLNRDSEKGDRPPRPSDLRESGSIEQDADAILLLSRQNTSKEVIESNCWHIRAELAKNRNGPTGVTTLLFNRSYTRYETEAKVDTPAI
ncbi:MAG: replicative DNA helicase [Verrucomicrobiaceae bacterium]|nr:replicative DNA helicase [Verrucomicrobiaceae bacterium]